MSKIFKPRRGKASTMNGTKSSTVLAAGEMFIELPDTGVGTGICKMKMGDGVTAYGSLPYAMGGDIATTEITGNINDDTSSTATAALANVTTGKTLGSIIGSLRRACSLNAQAIATLNDEVYNYRLRIDKAQFDSTKFPLTMTATQTTALIVMNFDQSQKSYIGYIANPIAKYQWDDQNDKIIIYGYDSYNGNRRIHIKNTYSVSLTINSDSDISCYMIYLAK
jgi:hypothetical protein